MTVTLTLLKKAAITKIKNEYPGADAVYIYFELKKVRIYFGTRVLETDLEQFDERELLNALDLKKLKSAKFNLMKDTIKIIGDKILNL